jgi:hypothetical protein
MILKGNKTFGFIAFGLARAMAIDGTRKIVRLRF